MGATCAKRANVRERRIGSGPHKIDDKVPLHPSSLPYAARKP